VAAIVCLTYAFTKHWILNNVLAIGFTVMGVRSIVLPNFKIGLILLWGLFLYDIFWVFGTDVMVTVAKSLDGPIKLIFPYDFTTTPMKFSMLGLGDIVIPGLFVTLCLKYDIDKGLQNIKDGNFSLLKTPYFNCCYLGYLWGIATVFAVMIIFNQAQPALLFLVPGCTFSILIRGLWKRETQELWKYQDDQ